MKKKTLLLLAALLVLCFAAQAALAAPEGYTLRQVTILSRHNLRAPLSSNGSVPSELTPHAWINWSANSSELTLKGGVLETRMGQYFRQWLESEGLIPENYVPAEGDVRFFARNKQRCIATARYFATGMMPTADVHVAFTGDADHPEDIFKPVLRYYSDAFVEAAIAMANETAGENGFASASEALRDGIRLVMDVADIEESEIYQSGKYGDLLADPSGIELEPDAEPNLFGPIKTANQVADALMLQYYESPDPVAAAFGHELTEAQWKQIVDVKETFGMLRHGSPLIALSIANPVVKDLYSELKTEGRLFSFDCAHDCTILGVLASLGVVDYELPNTLEKHTPIGVKLVFQRLTDESGAAWYDVSMIYQSTAQTREVEELTLANPPMKYALDFEGIEKNADGLIAEADLLGLFERAMDAFDQLDDQYGAMEAAA